MDKNWGKIARRVERLTAWYTISSSELYTRTFPANCTYWIPVILVEPEGFQLEIQFILLAPLHEVRLGSRQLSVT